MFHIKIYGKIVYYKLREDIQKSLQVKILEGNLASLDELKLCLKLYHTHYAWGYLLHCAFPHVTGNIRL